MVETSQPLPRRRVLQLGALGAAVGAASAAGVIRPTPAWALVSYNEIWGQRTYYEGTGQPSYFSYEPGFYARLETWLQYWYVNTPGTWLTPLRVWSYGAYVNKPGAHGLGRAFDLTRLYVTSGGTITRTFRADYNNWRNLTGTELTLIRRWYWGTSASLHYHFRHVLTYPYNSEHWNHIHIDNLISGSGNSNFATSSEAQVKHVQACCTYIWGYSTTIDGIWGPQSDTNSRRVLARVGRSGGLTTSQSNWLLFNHVSTRYGMGTQAY
ncbi:MAG TPA: hypothetical protein VF109_07280 [Mycobacteriales bacterium]